MSSLKALWRHWDIKQQTEEVKRGDPAEVLSMLHPPLRRILASLHGAPEAIANATVQLLPFGSRAALECTDPKLVTSVNPTSSPGDQPGRGILKLTPFAFEVIALAAANADNDHEPEAMETWVAEAKRAAEVQL